ncbi:UDP-N-acetylmuramate dehydrogenase [Buchananella hordeovulneris]|uniref:UDP-N-acetylenolpyruvoylglucosamine reductase n=1 Tax=Buchananella hordeovulneris TaxID=52770 RepID=A0A1Q5PYK3_9ACTO|nr:UDP-N-acetylmuramate dehydrogenase [Buchananella hordeovulneris]OKL52698.1 UDP-N-acetylenolpyruvoylglucosamine reductase [Buchananella hordeovulneris]
MTCEMPGPALSAGEHSALIPPVTSVRHTPGTTPAPTLAELTTLRVGGAPAQYLEAHSEEEMTAAIAAADAQGQPLLVLGGGSNVLAHEDGFAGLVLRDARTSVVVEDASGCGGVTVRATAGVPWDDFVHRAVVEEWMGLEALSGIPGTVGAAPVQNIGAYGAEVAGTLASVRVYDRERGRTRLLPVGDLKLGYRTSVLKTSRSETRPDGTSWGATGRYVVLEATFQFRNASLSAPVRYAELARALGVNLEDRAPAASVRAAVLELRRGKGMVLDDADHDTWSAGSFFLNPVLSEAAAATLPADAPRFAVRNPALATNILDPGPVVPGLVKTSAAWLIARAGFAPGYGTELTAGRASLSTKHVLAITNRGAASAADIRAVSSAIQQGVREAFGVELEPEPVVLAP